MCQFLAKYVSSTFSFINSVMFQGKYYTRAILFGRGKMVVGTDLCCWGGIVANVLLLDMCDMNFTCLLSVQA